MVDSPVKVGDVVEGKYVVERVLGTGGMGVVVAAHHRHLDRVVALKFMVVPSRANPDDPERADDADAIARFLREGRAAGGLRGENVARILDACTLPDGTPYLVMEYLEGENLAERIDETGPLAVTDAVDYVLQACAAMAEAHVSGIIHRDLKPENLFLTERPDGTPLVKVLDFGISKQFTAAALDAGRTAAQVSMGSPNYMPPEQIKSAGEADARADIWALGLSLFELLSKTLPFTARTAPEVFAKILYEEPRSLCAAAPWVPEPLEAVVLQCLRKKPDDRFQTVAELAEALAPFASASGRAVAESVRVMVTGAERVDLVSSVQLPFADTRALPVLPDDESDDEGDDDEGDDDEGDDDGAEGGVTAVDAFGGTARKPGAGGTGSVARADGAADPATGDTAPAVELPARKLARPPPVPIIGVVRPRDLVPLDAREPGVPPGADRAQPAAPETGGAGETRGAGAAGAAVAPVVPSRNPARGLQFPCKACGGPVDDGGHCQVCGAYDDGAIARLQVDGDALARPAVAGVRDAYIRHRAGEHAAADSPTTAAPSAPAASPRSASSPSPPSALSALSPVMLAVVAALAWATVASLAAGGLAPWALIDRIDALLYRLGFAALGDADGPLGMLAGPLGMLAGPAVLAAGLYLFDARRALLLVPAWWLGEQLVVTARAIAGAPDAGHAAAADAADGWGWLLADWDALARAHDIAGVVAPLGIAVMVLALALLAWRALRWNEGAGISTYPLR